MMGYKSLKWKDKFKKDWDKVCSELKQSGVDLSKIYICINEEEGNNGISGFNAEDIE